MKIMNEESMFESPKLLCVCHTSKNLCMPWEKLCVIWQIYNIAHDKMCDIQMTAFNSVCLHSDFNETTQKLKIEINFYSNVKLQGGGLACLYER